MWLGQKAARVPDPEGRLKMTRQRAI
jgi:hypothetical protein